MTQFSATFTFEADTPEDAEEIVGQWTVTPDVTLVSVSGVVQVMQAGPQPIPYGGNVAAALDAQPPPPMPPPPPLPPT
jgi:hypothetical protein